jgi:hypothetical protein
VLQVKFTITARAIIASQQPLLPIIRALRTQLSSIVLAQDPIIIQRASLAQQFQATTSLHPTHMQVTLTRTHMLSTAQQPDLIIMTSTSCALQQTRVVLLGEASVEL